LVVNANIRTVRKNSKFWFLSSNPEGGLLLYKGQEFDEQAA
jgi:hypothetical protein